VVGGVLGILGAIIGLVAERWMHSWGRVRCTLTSMEKTWRAGPDRRILAEDEVDRLEAFDQIEAQVKCDLEFFNRKDVDIGLSRLALVFIAENGEEVRLLEPAGTEQEVRTVDIISGRWSKATVVGWVRGPGSRLVRDWHTIEVRGAFPDHSLYKDPVMRRAGAEITMGMGGQRRRGTGPRQRGNSWATGCVPATA